MNKTLALLQQGFESSSGLTPEFNQFYKTFKKEFTCELKSVGATDIVFSRGHFYVSGFFTIGKQAWYFSLSDVRGIAGKMNYNYNYKPQLMYREAKDYKDYTGGVNRWVDIKFDMSADMCWYFKIV